MNDEQYRNFKDEMKTHLEGVVVRTVNGKIDTLRKEIKPVVEFYENITFLDKALRWTSSAVISIGAGVGVVYAFIKYLK